MTSLKNYNLSTRLYNDEMCYVISEIGAAFERFVTALKLVKMGQATLPDYLTEPEKRIITQLNTRIDVGLNSAFKTKIPNKKDGGLKELAKPFHSMRFQPDRSAGKAAGNDAKMRFENSISYNQRSGSYTPKLVLDTYAYSQYKINDQPVIWPQMVQFGYKQAAKLRGLDEPVSMIMKNMGRIVTPDSILQNVDFTFNINFNKSSIIFSPMIWSMMLVRAEHAQEQVSEDLLSGPPTDDVDDLTEGLGNMAGPSKQPTTEVQGLGGEF